VDNYEEAKSEFDFVFDRNPEYIEIPMFSKFEENIKSALLSKNLKERREFEGGQFDALQRQSKTIE
jgi:hypothetical protein